MAAGRVVLPLGLAIYMVRGTTYGATTAEPQVVGTTFGASTEEPQVVLRGAQTEAVWSLPVAATTAAQGATTVATTATAAQGATTAAATTTAAITTAQAVPPAVATTVAATTTSYVGFYFPTAAVTTKLIARAEQGTTSLQIESSEGFEKGQMITIDPGTDIMETATIVGFASLVIKDPLKYPHAVNAVIQARTTATTAIATLAVTTITPAITQTVTPPVVAKHAVAEVQQEVVGQPNPLLVIGLFVSAAIIAIVFRAARRQPRQSQEFQVVDTSDSESLLE